MSRDTVERPTKPCSNPHCGGTIYEPSYARNDAPDADSNLDFSRPIWRCCNCHQETPRVTRHRRSNNMRASDALEALKADWRDTDAALRSLVDSGVPSGCLMVYGSSWNYHLDALRGLHLKAGQKHLTNWEVRYHAAQARQDLTKAQEFVRSKQTC